MKPTRLVGVVVPLLVIGSACAYRPGNHQVHLAGAIHISDTREGWLGVSIRDVTPRLAREKNLTTEEGAYVADVEDDSPAEMAGIRTGDVIIRYDDTKITDADDLIARVRKTKPGTEVAVTVLRDGEQVMLNVTIERRPREPRVFSFRFPPMPRFYEWPHYEFRQTATVQGMRVETLTKQLAEYFGAPKGRGVLVTSVRSGSDADRAGFKAGDVIIRIEDDAITDVHDLLDALRSYRKREKIDVEIIRKGTTQKISWSLKGNDEDVSWDEGDRDAFIDLYFPEEFHELRNDAKTQLQRELERLRDKIEGQLRELNNKLRKQFNDAPPQVRTT